MGIFREHTQHICSMSIEQKFKVECGERENREKCFCLILVLRKNSTELRDWSKDMIGY